MPWLAGSDAALSRLDRRLYRVTDAEIEEIWSAVPDGTPTEIRR
jgi:hypothetical protein